MRRGPRLGFRSFHRCGPGLRWRKLHRARAPSLPWVGLTQALRIDASSASTAAAVSTGFSIG
jgi:hypothetical protein